MFSKTGTNQICAHVGTDNQIGQALADCANDYEPAVCLTTDEDIGAEKEYPP